MTNFAIQGKNVASANVNRLNVINRKCFIFIQITIFKVPENSKFWTSNTLNHKLSATEDERNAIAPYLKKSSCISVSLLKLRWFSSLAQLGLCRNAESLGVSVSIEVNRDSSAGKKVSGWLV